jgi:hypothetical protein
MVVADDSHNHVISNVDGLQTALDGKTTTSRTITAGDGLTGGGDFTANRTINVGAGSGITVSADAVSHADTSSQASVNNSNGTVIQDVTLDTYGHVTGLTSANLDGRYYTETEADSRFVNVTGDTMTGNLVLEDSELHVGDTSNDSWTRIRHVQADSYGFNWQHDNATVIVNEQGSTNEALVLGDVDVGNNSGLFGISHSTGGAAYVAKLDLRGNGELYIGSSATSRVFHDGYHPNADKWTTARTLSLSGDASGSVSWDGSANATLSVSVGDADTVDSLHASSFLRSDANDSTSGQLTVSSSSSYDTEGNLVVYGSGKNSLIIQVDDNESDRGIAFRNSGGAYIGYINIANRGSNLGDMVFGVSDATETNVNAVDERLRITKEGNVTVSGTVDGRDLASDGSKLDGIESGATADQTASEILTAIKTVDGSGSGLDADLLDGVQGSSYLRSDANDTMSGALTISTMTADALNFTANTTSDSRGIAFNSRTALSADYNDGWLRLNQNNEFSNGTYTPGNFRADGDIGCGGTLYHSGDTNTGIVFGTDTISIKAGNTTSMYFNSTGVRLGDSGNGYFKPVSGNYGSIEIDGGSHGGYQGYSISGEVVFMAPNTGTEAGIYNDVDNEWMIVTQRGGRVDLYEDGSVKLRTTTTGVTVYGDLNSTSDIRYKKNIETIDSALEKVQSLRGVTFDWDNDAFEEKEHTKKPNFTERATGVIAQDVEKVLPEAVRENEDGFKNVAYGNMVGLLIEAIKEQQEQIDALKKQLNS